MAHYRHADCRKALDKLELDHRLLTSDSIHSLASVVSAYDPDCILIGTNALHDAIVREHLASDLAKSTIDSHLASGRGMVVMMQYKAAYDDYTFGFIPESLGAVKALPRPDEETAATSLLSSCSGRTAPPLTRYPHLVSLHELEQASRDHGSLTGVYWHHWRLDQSDAWECHISCKIDPRSARNILVTSGEHTGARIVLSALPLDWHDHQNLFHNVLSYAVDGRHDTAFLTRARRSDLIGKYLEEKLVSIGATHRVYENNPSDVKDAIKHLLDGIHNTLFVHDERIIDEFFDPEDISRLDHLVTKGRLRIVSIESDARGSSVKVSGQRSVARDAYELIVPAIGQALLRGYIDGSFRGTVASLRELEALPYGLDSGLFSLKPALAESDRRDRAGSYDEVIGATSALLWLRGKTLGAQHPRTVETAAWVRQRVARADPRERLHSLGVFSVLGIIDATELDTANATLSGLDIEQATEIELASYLDATLTFGRQDVAVAIVTELSKRQDDDANPLWIDIPTTAGLITLLIRASQAFPALRGETNPLAMNLLKVVVPAMVAVESAYYHSRRSASLSGAAGIPWDGKLTTAIRCVAAWLHFDEFLAAPAQEAAEAVVRSSRRAATTSLAEGAVLALQRVVQGYNEANEKLVSQTNIMEDAAAASLRASNLERRTVNLARLALTAWTILVAVIYVIGDHLVRTLMLKEDLIFGQSLIDHFPTHVAFVIVGGIAFLSSMFAIPWVTIGKFAEKKLGAMHPQQVP